MFNPTRAKVQLKLSVNRLQLLQNKKNMLAQQHRKEIARLLEIGKEESARIRVCKSPYQRVLENLGVADWFATKFEGPNTLTF